MWGGGDEPGSISAEQALCLETAPGSPVAQPGWGSSETLPGHQPHTLDISEINKHLTEMKASSSCSAWPGREQLWLLGLTGGIHVGHGRSHHPRASQ